MRLRARSPTTNIRFAQKKLRALHWGSAIPALPQLIPSLRNAIPSMGKTSLELARAIHASRKRRPALALRSPRYGPRLMHWRASPLSLGALYLHSRERA